MDRTFQLLMMTAGSTPVSAVQYISSAATSNSVAGPTLTINQPSGTTEGRLMIAICGADSPGRPWTQPSGWTEVSDTGIGNSPMVSYKIAASGEPANYTFTVGVNRRLSGAILTFANATYDTVGTISTTVSSNVFTAPSISLSSDNGGVIAVFMDGKTSQTWSNPSAGLITASTDADGTLPSFAMYYQLNVSAGATGNKTATSALTPTTARSAFLIGIKPS